jgi:hypothetical protein
MPGVEQVEDSLNDPHARGGVAAVDFDMAHISFSSKMALNIPAERVSQHGFSTSHRASDHRPTCPLWVIECREFSSQLALNRLTPHKFWRSPIEVQDFRIGKHSACPNSVEVTCHNNRRLTPTVLEHTVSLGPKKACFGLCKVCGQGISSN